jgi:hypothetical protein
MDTQKNETKETAQARFAGWLPYIVAATFFME